jgi:hypothetical protein
MEWILNKDFDSLAINYPINKGNEGFKLIAEKDGIFDLSKV